MNSSLRRLTAPLLLSSVLLAVMGTACSSGISENDQEFVSTVGERVSGQSPDKLIAQAQAVCEALESGSDPIEVYLTTMASGLSPDEAQALMVGAAVFYCPAFEQDVVVGLYSFNTQ